MKKQFKRLLLVVGLLVCLAFLASCTMGTTTCTTHTDADKNYICDTCNANMDIPKCTMHIDNDNDGYCDILGCEEEVLMQMIGITFSSVQCDYDGEEHSVVVKGAPYNAEIEYFLENDFLFSEEAPNVQKNAGTYKITAYVSAPGYEDYEATAILQILPKHVSVDWSGNEDEYPANGTAPQLNYTLIGISPEDEGKVKLKLDYNGYNFKEQGVATVYATLNNSNYSLSSNTNTTKITFGPNVS